MSQDIVSSYASVSNILSTILPCRSYVEPVIVTEDVKRNEGVNSEAALNAELLSDKIVLEVFSIFKNSIPPNAPSVKSIGKTSTQRISDSTPTSIEKPLAPVSSHTTTDPQLTSEHFLKSLPDLSFMLVK